MELVLSNFLMKFKNQNDGTAIDRLNYQHSPLLLLAFSLTVLSLQLFGNAIHCFPPAEFTHAWREYIEADCLVQSPYFVRAGEHFLKTETERQHRQVHFYKWAFMILLGQAFVFLLPKALLNVAIQRMAVDVNALISCALKSTLKTDEQRNGDLLNVANKIRDHIVGVKNLHKRRPAESSHSRHVITILYILFKALNLVNAAAQFHLINSRFFTTAADHFSAPNLLLHPDESEFFPRIVFCDVSIRQSSVNLKLTVQCALLMNIIIEKIFILLWFWFFALVLLNLWSLQESIVDLFTAVRFVKRRLVSSEFNDLSLLDDERVKMFVQKFLSRDGVTLLRMIHGTQAHAAAKIVEILYEEFTLQTADY